MNAQELARGSYEPIAREYYDPVRHPTCSNFGELSERFITPWLLRSVNSSSSVLDVGAGRSIAATILAREGHPLDGLVVLDHSPSMLAHSREWVKRGARAVVADARATGLDNASFDIIVSSLGDPYNQLAFWQEAARLLRPHGQCFFTTPTFEWASRFRAGSDSTLAEFLVADGGTVHVPSYTLPTDEQESLMRKSGFEVTATHDYFGKDLRHTVSPKLVVDHGGYDSPVVRGYAVEKRSAD